MSIPSLQSIIDNGARVGIPLAVVFGACGGVASCYNSNQHDRRVWADFRGEAIQNPTSHIIKIETDGVTREGNLSRGAAFNSQSSSTALIIAGSPQATCYYSTLRVTNGSDKLPLWEKIFGGSLSEEYFVNSAFSGFTCAPVSDPLPTGLASQPAPAPLKP